MGPAGEVIRYPAYSSLPMFDFSLFSSSGDQSPAWCVVQGPRAFLSARGDRERVLGWFRTSRGFWRVWQPPIYPPLHYQRRRVEGSPLADSASMEKKISYCAFTFAKAFLPLGSGSTPPSSLQSYYSFYKVGSALAHFSTKRWIYLPSPRTYFYQRTSRESAEARLYWNYQVWWCCRSSSLREN